MLPRKILLMLFSLVLIGAFLMPWFTHVDYDVFDFNYLIPGNGIAGYEVLKYEKAIDGMPEIKEIKKLTGRSVPPPVYYAAFLIPAFAVACIVTSLIGTGARIMGLLTGALPMLGFAALIIKFGDSVPNHMTYGAFLTLAAALALVVTSLTKT